MSSINPAEKALWSPTTGKGNSTLPIHVIAPGETLASIADKYRFADDRTIWDHPQNARLKSLRPSLYILHPGDVIFIPENLERQESRTTGSSHAFVVRRATTVLRLCLEDEEGERFSDTPYTLKIEKQIFAGTTDGQGMLIQQIPAGARLGEVTVRNHVWPLDIGKLNPVDNTSDKGVSGIKARLRNLGYDPGPVDERIGEKTRAAIKAFQKDEGLPEDGECGANSPSLSRLIERHGC